MSHVSPQGLGAKTDREGKSEPEASGYTTTSDTVLSEELGMLKVSLGADGTPTEILSGLAFSGGGIRSASFALGASEALANRGLLTRFHYLSTVSGGGYLGAAITWLRYKYGAVEGVAQLGDPNDKGARGPQASAAAESAETQEKRPRAGAWLAYLRQHGNYLLPSSISPLALVGMAARGAVVSVAVYFAFLVAGLFALLELGVLYGLDSATSFRQVEFVGMQLPISWDVASLLAIVVALFLVGCIGFSVATLVASFAWSGVLSFARKDAGEWRAFGSALASSLAFTAGVLLMLDTSLHEWMTCGAATVKCGALEGTTIAIATLGVISLMFVVHLVWTRRSDWYYTLRVSAQQHLGSLLGCMVVLGVLALLPPIHGYVQSWKSVSVVSLGNLLTALGAVGAAVQAFLGRSLKAKSRMTSHVVALVSVAFVSFGLLLLAFAAARFLSDAGMTKEVWQLVMIAAIVAAATNLNLFNLGRMYRDRLMETFQPESGALIDNRWSEARSADVADLHDVWPPAGSGPPRLLPLVNCSAVLGDATSDKYRNRGSDSFVLSPVYSGCDATGWIRTSAFADKHLSLATAVATSGAAVNPHAAGGGSGITRDRLVSSLMFFFQVRLGCWVLNPALEAPPGNRRRPGALMRAWTRLFKQRPNFLVPGIWSGLLGRGMHERAPYVELTDGGHFDNTGIYELLRRRNRLIVLVQGGADPSFQMEDLANAIEKARVDFGIEITFRRESCVDRIRPTNLDEATKLLFATRGFAIADVVFPEAETKDGVIVYLQATRLRSVCNLENEPHREGQKAAVHEDVTSYAMRETNFPNETTLDQFFNEVQLEAYRELGYATMKDFLEEFCPASKGDALQELLGALNV